ncbi:unnamed protein product [Heligmosomoides polygyrus]|uniref:ANK_REP_REGION domain-containing protein n=1 Tax=Heligmosomoides polygyrus TaxID=6339 RepID=A0A183GJ72_HELPZ|nr:unnamed protein product [Heligmosomoides polygyrus]
MFGPRRGTAVMAIRRDCIGALLVALQRTRNYTNPSKFILGVEDLSRCTGSENEALSFVVFLLATALNMFSESVGAVAVLAYWMLVRVLENTRELTEADFRGVRDLGTSMKNLCYALDPTLITLKIHCLVDHAVLEDLPLVESPYHWSSSSIESTHRCLQLRVPQCTTNVEETIIENFLLHKDMVDKLEKEFKIFQKRHLDRLHKKIADQGRRPRCVVMVGDIGLEGDWYVPADSVLAFEGMGEEHRQFLLAQVCIRDSVVMQGLARDNEISLRELGATLAHFDTGAQYHAFITGKMRECSISLNSVKAIQDTCSQIPHSSDSIVRSLTEVVAAKSDALVGVVTTLNALLEFARANRRTIAKTEAIAVKNSSKSLPDEFFLHGRHLTRTGMLSLIHHLRYWEALVNDNSSRSQAFQERKEYRAISGPFFRDTLTKAIAADVASFSAADAADVADAADAANAADAADAADTADAAGFAAACAAGFT